MRQSGFSLIELMIVVAIIGLLAAIAIPNFTRYQMKAKASEALTNVQGISKVEETYYAEFGRYVSVTTPVPASPASASKADWTTGSNFDVLGWAPEGQVYFRYAVAAEDPGGGSNPRHYTVEAGGDVDGDGGQSFFGYVKPLPGAGAGLDGILPGTTCVGTGVYDAATGTQTALRVVGACDGASGQSRF